MTETPAIENYEKSISSSFLKMVGIFNFYKLPFDIDFIVLCRLMKTFSDLVVTGENYIPLSLV